MNIKSGQKFLRQTGPVRDETGTRRRAYFLLLVLSVAWSAGTFASPLFFDSGKPAAGIISRVVYAPICHQDPARSFHCCGYPLSVCERCASIYFAFTLAILFLPLLLRCGKRMRCGGPGDFSFKRFLLFLIPMVLDYGLDVLGAWQNAPLSRSVSGGIAGIGLALFVLPGWMEAWVQLRGGSDISKKQEVSHG